MVRKTRIFAAVLALLAIAIAPAWSVAGVSAFQTRPDDPLALTVKAVGDGKADDTAAIQTVIDTAAKSGAGSIV